MGQLHAHYRGSIITTSNSYHILLILLDNKLHLAPIPEKPHASEYCPQLLFLTNTLPANIRYRHRYGHLGNMVGCPPSSRAVLSDPNREVSIQYNSAQAMGTNLSSVQPTSPSPTTNWKLTMHQSSGCSPQVALVSYSCVSCLTAP